MKPIDEDLIALTKVSKVTRLLLFRYFLVNRGFAAIYTYRKIRYHSDKGIRYDIEHGLLSIICYQRIL